MSIGASKLKDPKQIVITLDHDVQNKSEKNLTKYRQIEEFARWTFILLGEASDIK